MFPNSSADWSISAYTKTRTVMLHQFENVSKIQQVTGMSFQEAISDENFELTMEKYEKLNMSAFNRTTGGITLEDLSETMFQGTRS